MLTGPAAARITAELQQAAEQLDAFPGHVADAARVRVMLGHVAQTLFVGVIKNCFFNPATALCLSANTNRSAPAMAQFCHDRCPNSCIASHHRPMWRKAAEEICGLLSQNRLPALQRIALEQELARIKAVISGGQHPASGGHRTVESERAAPGP